MMSNGREHKYIYNMFYSERLKLCRLLDENDKWKELAGHMQFDVCTVQVKKTIIKSCISNKSNQIIIHHV